MRFTAANDAWNNHQIAVAEGQAQSACTRLLVRILCHPADDINDNVAELRELLHKHPASVARAMIATGEAIKQAFTDWQDDAPEDERDE